jgi:hypothetical protein
MFTNLNTFSHKLQVSLIVLILLSGLSNAQPPKKVKDIYDTKVDKSISDEFDGNGEIDLKKWNYRQTKPTGIAVGKKFVHKENGKLICYGWKKERKAGGIVTKNKSHFGFIETKFKVSGIFNDRQTIWHPSIWGAQCNGQVDFGKECLKSDGNWLEIDMMEFENTPTARWSADAPARVRVESLKRSVKVNDNNGKKLGFKKAIMIKKVTDNFHAWRQLGLEYNPKYLQLWEVLNGEWTKMGRKIVFNHKTPSLSSIPKECASQMFWYLGNLFNPYKNQKFEEKEVTNSTLEIDYFRFYPLK